MNTDESQPAGRNVYEQRLSQASKLIMRDEEFSTHPFNQSEAENYVYILSEGNKQILFFGATHTNEPGHEQFVDIQKQFSSFMPDVVCIEGSPGINHRASEISQKLAPFSPEDLKSRGEGWYTLKLAVDAGIDFESPEPSFTDEVQHQLDNDHNKKDIFTYYVYRMIDQYLRVHAEKSIPACTEYLRLQVNQFVQDCDWSSIEIDGYFEQIISELDLNYDRKYANAVTPVPFTGVTQNITNDISRLSSHFRDEYILKRLAFLINKYERVFVIFDSAHSVRLEPAIQGLLGLYKS